MIDCTFKLLTAKSIVKREWGELLLSTLLKHFPGHIPQRYGVFEPLKKPVSAENPYSALDLWGTEMCYMTKRRAPKATMNVLFEKRNLRSKHSGINFFEFQIAEVHDLERLEALLLELAELFAADYAMAHILTRSELDDRLEQRLRTPSAWPEAPPEEIVKQARARAEREGYAIVLWGAVTGKLHTVHLVKGLSNLYWLNVFGRPYVELFGTNKLLRAPADFVQALPYGGVAVRLTKDLADSSEAWNEFKAVRASCQQHLDSNAFFDPQAPKDHKYRTPRFSFLSF
jgi:hypothetical protein